MKKIVSLFLVFISLCSLISCSTNNVNVNNGDIYEFVDSCERTTYIPKDIKRIAPCGYVAQTILYTIAKDLMCGLASEPSDSEKEYLTKDYLSLPVYGQYYGGKSNFNLESLLSLKPDLIIDMGMENSSEKEDMDRLEKESGIPVIYIKADINSFSSAYDTLGKILHREERAKELSEYTKKTINLANENRKKISDSERKFIYFGTGPDGLSANAKGSIQSEIIEIIGAENAISDTVVNSKNGGTLIDLEKLYTVDPDIIIFDFQGGYENAEKDERWHLLRAVKDKNYYEIPNGPYSYMSNPPSINKLLGIIWLGNLVYKDIYDYDVNAKIKEFYSLFWEINI